MINQHAKISATINTHNQNRCLSALRVTNFIGTNKPKPHRVVKSGLETGKQPKTCLSCVYLLKANFAFSLLLFAAGGVKQGANLNNQNQMKNKITLQCVLPVVLCFGLMHVQAQPGGGIGGMGRLGSAPSLSGSMKKVFGKHTAFTANVEIQVTSDEGKFVLPSKMVVLDNKARIEMDMAEIKGGVIPPDAAATVKQMGMDKTVTITRPDQETVYMIYPGLKAYAAQPFKDPDATRPESDYKAEVTELGKETIGGQACIKNKVVVTDNEDRKHEFTVWNATELDNFPVQIESSQDGTKVTWLFRDVKLGKPAAALFDPPSDYKKYDSLMALMQEQMMKRMQKETRPPQ